MFNHLTHFSSLLFRFSTNLNEVVAYWTNRIFFSFEGFHALVATLYIQLKMQQITRSAFRVRSLSLYAIREMLVFKSLPLPVGSMCNDTSLCCYTMYSVLQHILQNSELLSSSAIGFSCVRLNRIFLSSSRVLETSRFHTPPIPIHWSKCVKLQEKSLFQSIAKSIRKSRNPFSFISTGHEGRDSKGNVSFYFGMYIVSHVGRVLSAESELKREQKRGNK